MENWELICLAGKYKQFEIVILGKWDVIELQWIMCQSWSKFSLLTIVSGVPMADGGATPAVFLRRVPSIVAASCYLATVTSVAYNAIFLRGCWPLGCGVWRPMSLPCCRPRSYDPCRSPPLPSLPCSCPAPRMTLSSLRIFSSSRSLRKAQISLRRSLW